MNASPEENGRERKKYTQWALQLKELKEGKLGGKTSVAGLMFAHQIKLPTQKTGESNGISPTQLMDVSTN